MAKFEKFKPKLKPGRITPHGKKLIFETEKPVDQIVLPIELVGFLIRCDGKLSVAEIIEQLYHSGGSVQFKSIYKTLNYLRERGLLENGKDLELPSHAHGERAYRDSDFISFQPFYELPVGNRIFREVTRPTLFYAIAMLTILSAILSFQLVQKSWFSLAFLNISDSYLIGLAYIFLTSSVLLSLKNLFKCLLLILLTGRAYNFSFVFNGFAFYFRTKSDSLFLVSNRLYLTLLHLTLILCYFPIIGGLYFFFPNLPYINETMSLGLLLFLFDLNPFQESEASHLLRSLFNDDTVTKLSNYLYKKPLFALVHPGERNRDYGLYLFYTQFSLIWSLAIIYTSLSAVFHHHATFVKTIRTASLDNRIAAFFAFTIVISLLSIVSFNTFRLIYMSVIFPIWQTSLGHFKKRRSQRLDFFNQKELVANLTHLPLFNYLSSQLLEMIVNRSELKEYPKDTPVIVQGDQASHLYVLLSGGLIVKKQMPSGRTQNISEILPVSIFGEVAVIEEIKRTASVTTTEKSIVLEVPAKMLRQIADDAQYIREIQSFKNAISVNQFFSSAPVFKDLSETVVQYFISKSRFENFLPNQIIFKQTDPGDGFYLLLRGSVGVSVNGHTVTRIQQGGFFGEISMIADVARTATIYAVEPVQVLKISRDVFWEILSMDITMAMFIESVGEMRIREDIEILKPGSVRVA